MAKKTNAINTALASLRDVPIVSMRVSPAVQRELKQARVDKLAAEFDIEYLGSVAVSLRNGHYYIIDGQHRIEAYKRYSSTWEKEVITCIVHEGLNEAQEAEMFLRLNDALAVAAFDKYHKGVTANRPVETGIERILQAEGFCISREQVQGAISAVASVRRVYTRADGPTLRRALCILRDAFGDAGLISVMIDGVGHLCERYNSTLNTTHLIEVLSSTHGGVSGVLNKAEVLHKQTGRAKGQCVAAAVVDIHNRRSGAKKLPTWWKLDDIQITPPARANGDVEHARRAAE